MYCTVFMAGTAMMFAQFPGIGIIGDATPAGWNGADIDMATTDGVTYTLNNFTLGTGTVKFRQDDGWANNWGGTGWPSGVGVFNTSNNIPSQPGLYNITFNRTTLDYNFEAAGNFDTVSIMIAGANYTFFTTDGITYKSNNVVVANAATASFSVNGTAKGGEGFPSGTATVGGAAIAIPANSYNVVFNNDTGAYMFNFVDISITGDAVGGWGTDANMVTTDGFNYTLASQVFTAAEIKFRLNHDWGTTWGGATYPSGTAVIVADGGNMAIPAGTYSVTFNRETGAFAFSAPAAVTNYTKNTVVAYPNPANTSWTFSTVNGTLNNIQIVDLTGKVVAIQSANAQHATVNASALANGVYFAKVSSAEGTSVIKVVKN